MHINTSEQSTLELGFGGYSCNWGVHIAGLYETESERDDIIFGFLSEGAHKRDLQLYCPAERSYDNFCSGFAHQHSDLAQEITNPDLFQISSPKTFYYPDGHFSPRTMDSGLQQFYQKSQQNGKRNIRATAEMTWALQTIPGVEDLMIYESRLNYFIPSKPWISICLYNLTKFSGQTIMQVLQTHPYTLTGGVMTENPYYKAPEIWLSENAPDFLEK